MAAGRNFPGAARHPACEALNAAGELEWSRACGRLPRPREKRGSRDRPVAGRPPENGQQAPYVDSVRNELAKIIRTRGLSVADYEQLTDIHFASEEDLYDYLGKLDKVAEKSWPEDGVNNVLYQAVARKVAVTWLREGEAPERLLAAS
ncbi:hypothetical protein [Streptomyces sp. DSM 118878]